MINLLSGRKKKKGSIELWQNNEIVFDHVKLARVTSRRKSLKFSFLISLRVARHFNSGDPSKSCAVTNAGI